MIGILVATHGDFGNALLSSAELIVGKQDNIKTLGLYHGDNIDAFREKVKESIDSLQDGDGVLVFVDVYGGSPSNATALNTQAYSQNSRFECITGVNMPMFLEALTTRASLNLKELKELCISVGQKGIGDMYQMLDECAS